MRPHALLLLPLTAGTLFLGTGVAHADGNAPAGNNGTIKIDGLPFEDGNDNKPHPGCTFGVEFFGYDAGDRTALLEFEAQSPTDGGLLREQTERFTVAERTGGNQLDHRVAIDLTEQLAPLTPHPKQGYHVKLTVHVDGAKGADVKHKVFWVSECASAGAFEAEAPPATTTTVAPTTTTTAAPAPVAVPVVDESGAAAQGAPVPSPAPAGVLGASASAPSGELPRTGSTTTPLALAAIGMVVAGGALAAADRKRRA